MQLQVWIGLTLLRAVAAVSCPSQCTCISEGRKYSAACQRLHTVPRFSYRVSWNKIDLSGNDGIFIPSGIFAGLNITEIDLSSSRVSSLAGQTFKSVVGLKTLNLANNRIKELDQDTLYGLDSLLELRLEENRISYIDSHALRGLNHLNLLSLSRNLLTTVPETLRYLSALETLLLNGNHIRKIKAWTFSGFHPGTVDISDNHAPLYISNRAFCGLAPRYTLEGDSAIQSYALHTVGLRNNGLQSISPCGDNLIHAMHLMLDQNPIHCDCDIIFLRDMGNTAKNGLLDVPCASPRAVQGKKIGDLSTKDLQCDLLAVLRTHDCVDSKTFCRRQAVGAALSSGNEHFRSKILIILVLAALFI